MADDSAAFCRHMQVAGVLLSAVGGAGVVLLRRRGPAGAATHTD
jgi:hypothetical protein